MVPRSFDLILVPNEAERSFLAFCSLEVKAALDASLAAHYASTAGADLEYEDEVRPSLQRCIC